MQKKRTIRTGSVFQRSFKDRQGVHQKTSTWYLQYYSNGKPIRMSTGTEDYDEALTMLRNKMAQVPRKHVEEPERVTMGQLFDLLLEDYEFKARKSTYDTKLRVDAHLRPFFGDRKAQAVNTTLLRQYIAKRLRDKAEAATINKELSWTRRAMKIGAANEPPLVVRVPAFGMLPVDNAREGTLEHDKYRIVRDSLPRYARVALVIAYHTGSRRGEITSIQRDRIDLNAQRILLPGRTTKNGRPRYLPIYGDMAAELDMALAAGDPKCPFLIQDKGKRVFDFKKSWATACETSGIPRSLFHDLRRTALTNMIEAGLTEKEAMEISGHKTRAVFDRYHIVSERRLAQNAAKLGAHLKVKDAQTVPDSEARQETTIQ